MVKERPEKITKNKIFRTDIGDVFVNDDGILVLKLINNLDFKLEKAKSAFKICEEITEGKKVLVLVINGEIRSIPSETREYLSGRDAAKHRRAVALVITNLLHRLVALYIMRIRNKYYPTQIFTDESKAIEWLKQQ